MIRLLIADDHYVVREGLKRILTAEEGMTVVAEAATSQDTLDQLSRVPADVVVLDMSMPGRGGLDTLREVKRARPDVGVLVFSVHSEDQFAVHVLREGGDGYLTKGSAPEEIRAALRKIHNGGKFVSPALAERLALSVGRDFDVPPHERLSPREHQVMLMLASGSRVKDIAKELCLSTKTVSTYRSRTLEKMGLLRNAELTQYALEEGMLN